jgi:hypothetical protein
VLCPKHAPRLAPRGSGRHRRCDRAPDRLLEAARPSCAAIRRIDAPFTRLREISSRSARLSASRERRTIDNRAFDLSRRKAELALRTRRPTEGDLFGRRLAAFASAFYGIAEERPLRRHGDLLDLAGPKLHRLG